MLHLLELEIRRARALRWEIETEDAKLTKVQEHQRKAADLVEGVGL
jgi:hypothetical protein